MAEERTSFAEDATAFLGKVIGPFIENLTGNKPVLEKILRAAADVGSVVAKPITTLATYSPESEGAIRPRGAPDLNMFHGSDVFKLAIRLNQTFPDTPTLTAPSISIAAGRRNPFPSEINLLLNPTSAAFDPSLARLNQLYNTDAYVSRTKNVSGPRLTDARRGKDLRLTEGHNIDLEHALSIMLSPRFGSFAEFERGALGADLLRKATTWSRKEQLQAQDAAETAFNKFVMDTPTAYRAIQENDLLTQEGVNEVLNVLKSYAYAGDKQAQKAMKKLATVPPDYAELKLVDELPLTPDTVTAALISPIWAPDVDKSQRAYLSKRMGGVPVGTPEELLPVDMRETYNRLAHSLTRELKKGTEDAPRPVSSPYLTNVSFANRHRPFDELLEIVAKSISSSSQFEADVASILTSRASK